MMYQDLLIAIVVYKKGLALLPLLGEIASSQYDVNVFIYDNSPNPQEARQWDFVSYVHDPENAGVSSAYNSAFAYAKKMNKRVVILLDQDSKFKFDYIKEYFDCFNIYSERFLYAPIICDSTRTKIYSPATLNRFVGKVRKYTKIEVHKLLDLTENSVINSGLMIPISLLDNNFHYNKNIKLDFSDVFFIEKYKEKNKNIVLVPVEIEHSLSGDEGYDETRELHRFKFYCVGARELARDLQVNTNYTVFRRMTRLIIKYRTFNPIKTVINYYYGDNSI